MNIKKRKWVFEPTKARILLTIFLVIVFSFFSGQRTDGSGCTKYFYGLPAEIYHTDFTGPGCSGTGDYYIDIIGILLNLILWYPVSCLLAYVGGKLKYGI